MIRFYDNALDQLLNNPNLFGESGLTVLIAGSNYVFEPNHVAHDIEHQVTTPIDLSGIQFSYRNGNIVYEFPDIVFPLVSANVYLHGIVIYLNGSPFLYISDIPGLGEGSTVHGRPILSFSKSYNKTFTIVNDEVISGNHFVYVRRENEPLKEPETITRPGGNISRELVANSDYSNNSIEYKDLDIRGIAHPLTGDITTVSNLVAINQSIRNILLTNEMERPFSSSKVAGGVSSLLFSDFFDTDLIKKRITTVINNYEPRIILNDVIMNEYPDSNAISIELVYTVKRTAKTNTYNIMLERN